MLIAILSRSPKLYSTRRLKQVCEKLEHTADIVNTMRCYMTIICSRPSLRYKGQTLASIGRIGASVVQPCLLCTLRLVLHKRNA